MTKNIINKTLDELGIPGIFPSDIIKAMEAMKRLEDAGLIERKEYDLLSPWERYYHLNQKPQQPYF